MPREFMLLLVIGRWLVVASVVFVVVLHHPVPIDRGNLLVAGAVIAAYNVFQWVLLRRSLCCTYPPALVIAVDLALATLLVAFSGATRSPFLGLYYLVILIAAALCDLRGSLLTAAGAILLQLLVVQVTHYEEPHTPRDIHVLRLQHVVSTFPYVVLIAWVGSYLVRLLREQWEGRREAETHLAVIHRELEIARDVQSVLLEVPLPVLPGLSIGVHAAPLHGIGGDLRHYTALPDGVGIAVADISGHSVAAALLAVRLSELLEEAGLGVPLDEVAVRWNHTVAARTPPEVFVTAVFCEIAGTSSQVRYTVAGHPPPLLWRRAAAKVEALTQCSGALLGVLPEASYRVCETHLEIGDVLLLYTDGAIEAQGADGEMLGTEGLSDLLARCAHLPPPELVEHLAAGIRTGREVSDDMTLLAIARVPPAGPVPNA